MEKSLFNELTLEQKQKLLTLPAELKHFTQTQWAAIYGIVPMTQELFDSIQLERLKVGEQKAGKKQAEAQEDAAGDADFQEYHAMPDAPEMTLSDDTSAKEENGHDE